MIEFFLALLWQDWVIMGANITFIPALLPMVFGDQKPPIKSSVLTAAALWVITGMFITIGLWVSVVALIFTASLWTLLALQVAGRRWRERKDRVFSDETNAWLDEDRQGGPIE